MAGERQGGNSQQDVSTIEEQRLPPGVLASHLWGGKYAAKAEKFDSCLSAHKVFFV